jgi:UDPglucose 6-dehydrogenase
MRIAVYGLWHLGCVTAACLAAAGNRVIGLDPAPAITAELQAGRLPVEEPGLSELIAQTLDSKELSFTNRPAEALEDCNVLWVTFDTPVNDRDEADVKSVRQHLESIRPLIQPGTLVVISSQVPVGFTRALEQDWSAGGLRFAYVPENLRLGRALDCFRHPDRVIVGLRGSADRNLITRLFAPFTRHIEWMSIESAEMTKHALNAFLATSVTFINELARLCEVTGADAKEVERGLKSEQRIGPRAYLAPGAAFAGGTLARDVGFLVDCGRRLRVDTPFFWGVQASNDRHKLWIDETAGSLLKGTSRPVVSVLGLTYKPDTSTLRRSASVEFSLRLCQHGVQVQAHDPAVTRLPGELDSRIVLCRTPRDALRGSDLAIVATAWREYQKLRARDFTEVMRQPRVIDQNHFLSDILGDDPRLVYIATGRTVRC